MKRSIFQSKNLKRFIGITICLLFLPQGYNLRAQGDNGYQMPPKVLSDLVDVPPSPDVRIDPSGQWMLITQRPGMPSIEDLAQPELRIAGIRINPRTNGPSRSFSYAIDAKLQMIEGNDQFEIKGLPENPKMGNMSWSPDGQKIGFTNTVNNGLELWMIDLESKQAKRLTDAILNGAMRGRIFSWNPDSRSILFKSIIEGRGSAPEKGLAPAGPVVSENVGVAAPNRTYQDLIKSPYDESLFEYYTSSQLVRIDLGGNTVKLGDAGLISDFDPSPDGNYIMVEKLKRPFSYLVPYYRFAQEVNVMDNEGNSVARIADIPLAEDIPKGFDADRKGPRYHSWRADADATLVWAERRDGGDPKNEVEYRDQILTFSAPFKGNPVKGPMLKYSYAGMDWGNDNMAIVYERWWSTRREVARLFDPSIEGDQGSVLYDRSTEDRYGDPGNFVNTRNASGRYVLKFDEKGKSLFLTGAGYSNEGTRPFVDKYTIANGKTERLWRSESPYYEYPVSMLDNKGRKVIIRRESLEMPPNYFVKDLKSGDLTALTEFPNPYPQFKNVDVEDVQYKRKDGVDLSGTLYLPPGYKAEDGPLPTFIWAYPREYKDASSAGQRTDSPYRFSSISAWSPYIFVMKGIAVLDGASMPIVGEGDKEPNDTFVEQLRMNAEAAIDFLADKGVTDRERVAVGGHSYGAFMTANLLAHTDLFAAGIARSGAYNRTLTPFGFQREERTFWEAPELYFGMSPFMHAQKVKDPILLIHGQADNNSGTFPMQSERYYNALKGHGATAKLVMLPHESHGYRARESLMHMLYEMDQWLEKYINQKQ